MMGTSETGKTTGRDENASFIIVRQWAGMEFMIPRDYLDDLLMILITKKLCSGLSIRSR